MAMAGAQTAFQRKVELIFKKFDLDEVGSLDQARMACFVRTVNPGVPFTDLQMEAITEEVFEQYQRFVGPAGLSQEGLRQIYADGNGNVDIDFLTLGLTLDAPTQVAATHAVLPAAAVGPTAPQAGSKEAEDAFFRLALSAPSYKSHRASPAKPAAHASSSESREVVPAVPAAAPQVDSPASAPAQAVVDQPADAHTESSTQVPAAWASMDVDSSPQPPVDRHGSPAQHSASKSRGRFASLAVDTSPAALEPGIPSPGAGVSPKPQGSTRMRAATPTRGSRVASLAERFSEPSPLQARPPSPQRFRESQLAAKGSPLTGARSVNRSVEVRASIGSLRVSVQDAEPPPSPRTRTPGGSLVARLVRTLETSPAPPPSPPPRPATPSRRSPAPACADVAIAGSHDFEHLKDAQWVNARRSRARAGLSFDGNASQRRRGDVSGRDGSQGAENSAMSRAAEGAAKVSSFDGQAGGHGAKPAAAASKDSEQAQDSLDFESKVAEKMDSIQAVEEATMVEDIPGPAGWEAADDLFVERQNSLGQKVLEKSPSAVSITARVPRVDEAILPPANGGHAVPAARTALHIRMPSEAQEILEAANMAPLKVTVPYRGASFAAEEAFEDSTLASTSVAEQEAEVGRESLDSFEIAAHNPGAPSTASAGNEEKPEKLKDEIRAALLGGSPSPRQYAKLRSRADSLSSTDAAFNAHMEMGQLLAQRQQLEEAVSSFQAAIGRVQTEPHAYFRLGNALFSLDRLSEAEYTFRKALEVAQMPADKGLVAKVHTNLGITLEAQGLLLGACHQYREASALNATHYRSLKLLGGALFAMGDLQAAREALQAALALNASYPDAYCDLGCTLCALGEADAAKEAFENAIRLDNNHTTSLFNMGNLERQYGRYEVALGHYNAVLAVQPKHWRALLNSAVALIGLRRSEQAQAALKRAIQLSGQGEAVAEEVRLLKKLAKRGGDAAQVSRLVSAISEKTAARTTAPSSPQRPTPRRLWRVPSFTGKSKPGSSALARLGISPEQVPQILDLPLLRTLAPLTQVPSLQVLVETGSSDDTQQCAQAEQLTLAEAEALIHRLLPGALPPKTFQALMHCVAVRVLPALYDQSPDASFPGCADRGMLLSILITLSNESLESRAAAILAALGSSGRCGGANRGDVELFVHAAKAVFGGHAAEVQQDRPRHEAQEERVSQPQQLVAMLLDRDEGMPILSLLPAIANGEQA